MWAEREERRRGLSDHKVPFAPKPQRQSDGEKGDHARKRERERTVSSSSSFGRRASLGAALNDGRPAYRKEVLSERLREYYGPGMRSEVIGRRLTWLGECQFLFDSVHIMAVCLRGLWA